MKEENKKDTLILFLYRGLGLMATALIPLYRILLPEAAIDPMWIRYVLSGISLGIVVLTYFPKVLDNYINQIVYAYTCFVTVWILFLCYANNLAYEYGVSYFIILFCGTILFANLRILLAYFSLNLIITGLMALTLENPVFDLSLFFTMEISVIGASSFSLTSKFWERDQLKADQRLYRMVNEAAFNTSNDAIIVTDPEGKILHYNDLFLEMWGLTRLEIDSSQSRINFHKIRKQLKNAEQFELSFRKSIKYPAGKIFDLLELLDERYVERVSRPLFQDETVFGRIWFYRDVTAIKQQEAELIASKQRLRRQNDVLVQLASGMALQGGDLISAFDEMTETISDVLGTSRTSIWLFGDDMDQLVCKSLYSTRSQKHSRGMELFAEDNPRYFEVLHEERVFAVSDTRTDPRTKFFNLPYVKENKQRALLDVPIRAGGIIVGVLSAEIEGRIHIWNAEAQSFLASIGDLVAVALEASERQKAEKQLQQSLAVLKSVFELSGIGILVTTNDRKVIDFNELYLDIWKMDKEFLTQSPAEEVIAYCQTHLSNKASSKDSIQYLLENPGKDNYHVLEFSDGRFIERFTSALEVPGQLPGRVWFFRDITARINANSALRASEQKNKAILNAIPDLMFRLEKDGRILDFKIAEHGDLAALVEDIDGKHISEILPDEFSEKVMHEIDLALDSEELREFEIEMTIVGAVRDYEARIVQSGPEEVLLMVRDVTERKRTEKELIERNFELDSFVYRASHDLKAPLNSIMGLIQILRSESQDPGVLTYLGLMDKSVLKLDTFIRNLTDFSRIARLEIKHQKVEFEAAVNDIAESLQYMENSARVDLRVEVESGGPPLYADAFHIGIVLGNLISNAYKYQDLSKNDSTVHVKVKITEKQAEILVEDNGMGIPEKYQNRIFELFFRASNQSFGSGLGLYITRNAVSKMDGEITFSSREGEGTRFRVVIPNQIEKVLELIKV